MPGGPLRTSDASRDLLRRVTQGSGEDGQRLVTRPGTLGVPHGDLGAGVSAADPLRTNPDYGCSFSPFASIATYFSIRRARVSAFLAS